MIKVYNKKSDCCACGTCEIICPVHAITMRPDEYGYLYPYIDNTMCVDCKKCIKHCPMLHNSTTKVKKVYAAICQEKSIKQKSASGGAFAGIAKAFLEQSGIVCGAAACKIDQSIEVKHTCIQATEELVKLQGSKYVQSDLREVLPEIKKNVLNGKQVLFSGTPCQVAALYNYLGKKYENLTTIDLICHGVPSPIWWKKSIGLLEKQLGGSIIEVSFRDSEKWMLGHIGHIGRKGEIEYTEYCRKNSYYDLFLKGEIFRESCYNCPFAKKSRVADLTLGDYWGFSEEYDSKNIEREWNVDLNHGLSCILVNTSHGENMINNTPLWLYVSELEKVTKHNAQLCQPSLKGKNRSLLLKIYKIFGYEWVDRYCRLKANIWRIIHTRKGKK